MNLVTILLLLTPLTLSVTNAKKKRQYSTGFYTDNGQGQMIPYHVSSLREKRDMARNMMTVLGIPALTRRNKREAARNNTFELMTRANKAATRFIKEVYQRSVIHSKDSTSSEFSRQDQRTISASDVIVTYPATMRPRNPQDLWFEITLDGKTQVNQIVIKAELHLYQKSIRSPSYQVYIYEFVRPTLENERRRSRLVSAFEVKSAGKSGWIKLNVTRALQHWMERPKKTQRLRLNVKGVELELRDVVCLDEEDRQPFLVGYFEAKGLLVGGVPLIRTKRSSSPAASLPHFLYPQDSPSTNKLGCRLHTMHVRFSELDYDTSIRAPDGYDAQFCAGQCAFPLSAHTNPTNHALMQTLTRFLRPDLVLDYPSCAPKELDYLAVLYSTDNVRFVLMKYPNMVIRSCGCQ